MNKKPLPEVLSGVGTIVLPVGKSILLDMYRVRKTFTINKKKGQKNRQKKLFSTDLKKFFKKSTRYELNFGYMEIHLLVSMV